MVQFIGMCAGGYLLIVGGLQQTNRTIEAGDEWCNTWRWQHQKWYQCTCSEICYYWSGWGMWGMNLPNSCNRAASFLCKLFRFWLVHQIYLTYFSLTLDILNQSCISFSGHYYTLKSGFTFYLHDRVWAYFWICFIGMPTENSNCWQGIWHSSWFYISGTNASFLCLSMWTCLPCTVPDCPCDSLYWWGPCKYSIISSYLLDSL